MLARALLLLAVAASSASATYTMKGPFKTDYGYSALLEDATNTAYPSLVADVIMAQPNMVRIRISPPSSDDDQKGTGRKPYVIPDEVYPQSSKASASYERLSGKDARCDTYVEYPPGRGEGHGVLVLSCSNKRVLSLDFNTLAYEEQLVNISYGYAKGARVSGYMERNYKYFLDTAEGGEPVTVSLWNTDNGTPHKSPMYASYPILWFASPDSGAHSAVLNMNAHAQQATIDPRSSTVTLVNVGGIVDLHVFVPSGAASATSSHSVDAASGTPYSAALDVVRAYQQYVGPAAVPPYWSLGTHQCRWGYANIASLKEVPARYKEAGIPLETLWSDIDYMEDFKVFTIDQKRYHGLAAFVKELQQGGQRYVQIVDPGVATQHNYSVYESGEAAGAFMKLKNKTMVGVVWPGWTAFPDFGSPSARRWWVEQIREYSKIISLDGMWTDMNEIASFCGGACPIAPGTPWSQDWATVDWSTFEEKICKANGCAALNSSLNYPPFNPLGNGNELFTKTPDMEADTALGKYYETKQFYANLENIATHEGLLAVRPNERPFILSRAAFVGAGRSTFHWLGDNSASFDAPSGGMAASITGNMGSNLGGIFMVGADIAGFGGAPTTEELADRWYQLGSYYTFMRNHRALGGPETYQEPYFFSETAQAGFKAAIARRYRLLPYLFSCLLEGRLSGTPVTLHPAVVFADQPELYEESTGFMLGLSLYVAPAVTEGSTAADARLPSGLWYALADEDSSPVVATRATAEKLLTFAVPRNTPIPAFQRGGSMIPMHKEAKMLVKETKATGYSLVFAMDAHGRAGGRLNLDTNDEPITDSNVYVLEYTAIGTPSRGHVSVASLAPTMHVKPPFSELGAEAKIVLMFPEGARLRATGLAATLDGAPITAVSPMHGKYIFTLPAGASVADFGTLQWTAEATVIDGDDGDDSDDKNGGDAHKWKSAFVVAVSVLGVALVLAVSGLGFLIKRRREDAYGGRFSEGGESLPLNHNNRA